MIDPNYASNQGTFILSPGLQSGILIAKSSSAMNQSESPDLARFWTNFNGLYSGWQARLQDSNQYFQVGSSIPFVFEKLIIGGRYDFNQWITSFKITYSLDGSTWVPYQNSEIFEANIDKIQPVELILQPIIARSVRVIPISWNSNIGGRFEFFISKPIMYNVLPTNALISAVSSGFKVTVSSINDNGCGAYRAGYDIQISGSGLGSGNWCSGIKDQNQWIMITSVRKVVWKRIGTMGDSTFNQRVKSYYLMYSEDGSSWLYYKNAQVFIGNNDNSTKVEYDIEPFEAISLRFHPLTWTTMICMRIEAYCNEI